LSNQSSVEFGSVTDVIIVEKLKERTKLLSQLVAIVPKIKNTAG